MHNLLSDACMQPHTKKLLQPDSPLLDWDQGRRLPQGKQKAVEACTAWVDNCAASQSSKSQERARDLVFQNGEWKEAQAAVLQIGK